MINMQGPHEQQSTDALDEPQRGCFGADFV